MALTKLGGTWLPGEPAGYLLVDTDDEGSDLSRAQALVAAWPVLRAGGWSLTLLPAEVDVELVPRRRHKWWRRSRRKEK